MRKPVQRRAALIITLAIGLAVSGCSRVRSHMGFVGDQTLVEAIQPGVDNRESVEKTLGRPTFIGQFASNEWYYVARNTKQFAFAQPRAETQLVLKVSFDANGNVAAVEKSGVEKIARVSLEGDKTPTLGRERGFFEDIFGNIGQVGSVGQGGGTADNPNPN